MSTPVVTSKWAGTFECGTCRRKRLMGEEFSKRALERHRNDGTPLKCKTCVAASEQQEREQAQARRSNVEVKKNEGGDHDQISNGQDETRVCSGSCGKELSQSSYNRNQWSKGEGKSRCRECVEKAVQEEASSQTKAKEDKISKAKADVEEAKRSGNSAKIVAAESVLAALEAEKVTGLKPIKMGRGRGGRGRSGGRGGCGVAASGRGRR